MKHLFRSPFTKILSIAAIIGASAAAAPTENDYYPLYTVPAPEGVLLEAGGVATLPDGRVAFSTRRGKVWLISNPTDLSQGKAPVYTLFAEGLHEPLGLLYHQGAFYAAQRGELTKLIDTDGDDRADIYETVAAWPASGHYHEYNYGPALAPDGSFFVTTNVAFGDEEWWRGESRVPWRGWTLKIDPDGSIEPWATGMRSPAGLGVFHGELFYSDNQGDWLGSGGLWHVKKGVFTGHPAGLRWSDQEGSPVSLTAEQFHALLDERRQKIDGRAIKPQDILDEETPITVASLLEEWPELRVPAVVLPHGVLGISNAQSVMDESDGDFGPFSGQIFLGDQGQSKIMRIDLEKVNGEYQGVAFDFRRDFQSGVLRLAWGQDGTLFAGETNRGWGSAGKADYGLEFIRWSGLTPFEMKTVRAQPDGFEIIFTQPVDRETALDLASYSGRSYTYKYHSVYGSPQINSQDLDIQGVTLSDDGLKARIAVGNLRPYYVHEIQAFGLVNASDGNQLLHPSAYYTLNSIPDGAKLDPSQLSTKRSAPVPRPETNAAASDGEIATIDESAIQALLLKNACAACHAIDKKLVGPSYKAISARGYSVDRIAQLIYSPEPENWPDYPTPMAPMSHVSKNEVQQIATWIRSLDFEKPEKESP